MVSQMKKFYQKIKQGLPTHVAAIKTSPISASKQTSKVSASKSPIDQTLFRVRFTLITMIIFLIVTCVSFILYEAIHIKNQQIIQLTTNKKLLTAQLTKTTKQYLDLKNQDQYKINQDLKATINTIQTTYGDSLSAYQDILDLQAQNQKTAPLITLYAQTVQYLSKLNYEIGRASCRERV